jgi:hypothetical protein
VASSGLVTLISTFAIWWLVSALNQFRCGALTARLRRHIPFGLIPSWTFFAPNPARADTRLVWREQRGGEWSGWRELHFGFAPIDKRWLVNPQLILNKAVADLNRSLGQLVPELDDRTVTLSSAYVALLNIVIAQLQSGECSAVQFALVRSSGISIPRRVDIAFLSEVHSVMNEGSDVC